MDIQKEREAFETWFRIKHGLRENTKSFELSGGEYYLPITQSSWEGWQAAKANAFPKDSVVVSKWTLALAMNSIEEDEDNEGIIETLQELINEAQEPSHD